MKSFKELVGERVFIPNAFRSWGNAFKDNIFLTKKSTDYAKLWVKTPKFDQALIKNAVYVRRYKDFSTKKYYNQKLMSHMRTSIPRFNNFSTNYYVYLTPLWNSIYGDWDYEGASVVVVEEELYERDRLLQIFRSCPEGSYGYYAYRGLRPVKLVVQSFAAAEIDKFFASFSELLAQPMSENVDNVMSALETMYWNSRQEYVDWAAGQLIGQKGRSKTVSLAAEVSGWIEGERYTPLEGGRELTGEQWKEIRNKLISLTGVINDDTIDAFREWLGTKYDEFTQKNKEKD